jgi:hypothetical protein
MREVLMALQYVHAKGVSHLELSHRQIAVVGEGNSSERSVGGEASQMGQVADSGREFKHNTKILLTGFAQAFGFRKKNLHSQAISSVRPFDNYRFRYTICPLRGYRAS